MRRRTAWPRQLASLAMVCAVVVWASPAPCQTREAAPEEYQGGPDTSDGFGEETAPPQEPEAQEPEPEEPDEPEAPDEPDPPPPPAPISVSATIHTNPSPPKPGEQVEIWATVTGPDGKALSGAHKIWDVGKSAYGNVDPRFTWDGKELLVRLIVVYQEQEFKFTKTIPAYTEAAPPGEQEPASASEAPKDAGSAGNAGDSGSTLGVAAILAGVIAAAGGVIALAGVLIAKVLRPPVVPTILQPPPPAYPPPAQPPWPPPEPPHVRRPPRPPEPSDAAPPEGAAGPPTAPPGDKPLDPSEPPDDAPEDEEPPDEEPEDDEPEDEEPEDEAPGTAATKPSEPPADAPPDAGAGKSDDVGQAPAATAPPPASGSTAELERALGLRPSDKATTADVPEGDEIGDAAVNPQEIADLRDRMQQILDAKARDGYYIRNSTAWRKVWNNLPGRVIDFVTGNTGGQCGDVAEWGKQWLSAADVEAVFGRGAAYDTISIESSRFGDTLGHIANRVILPNGERYVVDFWEGLATGQAGPALVPEREWIDRWSRRCTVPAVLSETLVPVFDVRGAVPRGRMVITRSSDENLLKEAITQNGQPEGIRRYLLAARKAGPAALQAAWRTVWSYRRDPW